MSSIRMLRNKPALRMLIRADGSGSIGMGHVARCLTLALEIKRQGGECAFVTRRLDGRGAGAIKKAGFPASLVPENITGSGDLDTTLRAAKRFDAAVIVTDGYQFGEDYLRGLGNAGRPLVYIDDLARTFVPCDILLNQNPGVTAKAYLDLIEDGTRLLLGKEYALVRNEFIEARKVKHQARRRIQNVLVSLGGGDVAGYTLMALRALDRLDGDFTVTAVFGSRGDNTVELAAFLSGCVKDVHAIFYTSNMAGLMQRADMAITGGGTTCHEAACVGLPNLVIVLAENQWVVANGLKKARASVNLGWHEDVTEDIISRAAKRLAEDQTGRAVMRRNGRALVDGRGAYRVVKAIKDLIS